MKIAFVIFIVIETVLCGKYKPIEVEIKTNEGGEPLRIFTAEELAKYDGTDVSKLFSYMYHPYVRHVAYTF